MQEPLPMAIDSSAPVSGRAVVARPVSTGWRIDARTRRAGLQGVAVARAALEATRRGQEQGQPDAA